jgi:hypothetical protein
MRRKSCVRGLARAGMAVLLFGALPARAELEFESSGGTYFQYYLTQDNRFSDLPPGYRFAFSIDNLIYRTSQGHFFINAANATVISRQDSAVIKLDKIRYRIDPGFRLTEQWYEANFMLSHECIHQIDRERDGGSIFWNSLQANFGTKGAYDHNLVDRVVHRDFQLRNSLDYRVGVDAYLFGDASYFIAQNHDYRAHTQALLRYNWALWKKSAFYADLKQDAWLTARARWQNKGSVQLNWILLSRQSVGVLFTEYTYFDQNPFENEDALWSVGVRILY